MKHIGKKFVKPGKRKDVCTVTDVLTTRNSSGGFVSREWLYETEFLGKKVKGTCPQSTIILNEIKE